MKRTGRAVVIAAVLTAAACAGDGSDSERIRAVCDETGHGGFCSEYLGELGSQGLAAVRESCAGTWSTTGTCPTTGADASCTVDLADRGVTGSERFWVYDLENLNPDNWFKQLCDQLGGTYRLATP